MPCSIHETLLLTLESGENLKHLKETVHTVNRTQLDPSNRLPDNIYIYRRNTGQTEILCPEGRAASKTSLPFPFPEHGSEGCRIWQETAVKFQNTPYRKENKMDPFSKFSADAIKPRTRISKADRVFCQTHQTAYETASNTLKETCHKAVWNSSNGQAMYLLKKNGLQLDGYACGYRDCYGGRSFWELSDRTADILKVIAHFEAEGFTDISNSLNGVIQKGSLDDSQYEFTGCRKAQSQMYYCLKAAELLKPLGILALIVPRSFLGDSFADGGKILETEKPYSFLGQIPLPEDAFSSPGVSRFPTKLQFWQRYSAAEGCKPSPYRTAEDYILSKNFDLPAEPAFAKAALEDNQAKILFGLAKSHPSSTDFRYQTQKLLYQIKAYPATRSLHAKCAEESGDSSASGAEKTYQKPHQALCRNISLTASAYVTQISLEGVRKDLVPEAASLIEAALQQSGLCQQISTTFRHQNISKIDSLALTLQKLVPKALRPLYDRHLGLYINSKCLMNPSIKVPELYNDANGLFFGTVNVQAKTAVWRATQSVRHSIKTPQLELLQGFYFL